MRFESYDVRPIHDLDGDTCEVCEPEEADFWSLYGQLPNKQYVCIGDFSTQEGAEFVKAAIESG